MWTSVLSSVAVIIATGAVRIQTQAQPVVDQIEAVADTVESLTNNINVFGAVLVIVIVLVVALFVLMWRSANQARDARTDRLALEDRLTTKTAELILMTREFTTVARDAIAAHQNANLLGGQFVAQLEADRKAHAANVDKLIQASDDRYQKFHDEIRTFKDDHLRSIEQFGSRITSELSTGLSAMGKEFAQKHKEAVVIVAREQASMQQNIVNATVAALRDMNLLQAATVEPVKKDTGQLPDMNVNAENVTVTTKGPTNETPHPDSTTLDPNADANDGGSPDGSAGTDA